MFFPCGLSSIIKEVLTWQLRVYNDKHSKGEEEKATRFFKSQDQDCYCAPLFNGDIGQHRINSRVCTLDSLVYWRPYIGEQLSYSSLIKSEGLSPHFFEEYVQMLPALRDSLWTAQLKCFPLLNILYQQSGRYSLCQTIFFMQVRALSCLLLNTQCLEQCLT